MKRKLDIDLITVNCNKVDEGIKALNYCSKNIEFNNIFLLTHKEVSGNFDLINFNLRLNEISGEKKFTGEDITYIEKEFNDIVLVEDYASLFNFLKLKEFVRSVTPEEN